MPDDELARFLAALGPAGRERVLALTREQQAQLARAWEEELVDDTDLDTLDELSPAAAETEAAERVLRDFTQE
ncbi:hypothetical protein [Streptacidiphilus jiangxiensis]|uniref:Uncharacterized protein n=1 Tax=Streptacidiphilus jiangxiensis TaxID=235985 RepID=A0A1H7MYI3_STRJI|nr:hypothetical protein [Streptacidiphilus jiangxiensis]SEL16382.1 hypothetical protein SAMN05414137_106133 [Streptacidiphilus jiangxiensis]